MPSRATGRARWKGVNFLNFIWDKITEWLKGLLVSGILSNLNGLFDSINSKVGEVAAIVGQTPQSWNSSIFSMVRSLSDNVMIPIAGIILTLVACMELIPNAHRPEQHARYGCGAYLSMGYENIHCYNAGNEYLEHRHGDF